MCEPVDFTSASVDSAGVLGGPTWRAGMEAYLISMALEKLWWSLFKVTAGISCCEREVN
jgi:hypothetical protein